jgi:CRISPR/Cas system-associated endonuclease Cas1
VQDLIDPLKAKMVDRVVFDTAIRILQETDYEQASGRCILSENLARFLAESFRMSIDDGIVGEQVCGFRNSLWDTSSFRALY